MDLMRLSIAMHLLMAAIIAAMLVVACVACAPTRPATASPWRAAGVITKET